MQALVKYGRGYKELELREVPEPTIGPTDVLLEVAAAGVCGSDIEQWHDGVSWPVNVPVIQGHEFAGTIAAVGEAVRGFAAGDRCASETAAVICGRCRWCRTGYYNLCPNRLGFGYGTDGAFTQYVKVPERCLHRVPDSVPFEHACLTEPASVAYNALVVQTRICPGEPVAVIGPGPIGLFCLQLARICGATPIYAIGTEGDAARLETALQVGATEALLAPSAVARILAESDGDGLPVVVDAAGNVHAERLGIELVSRNGQITKVGWGLQPLELNLDPMVQKAAAIRGSFSHTWRTWEAVLALMAGGRLDLATMISHECPLADWLEAFELIERREATKVVLHPGG